MCDGTRFYTVTIIFRVALVSAAEEASASSSNQPVPIRGANQPVPIRGV